MSHLRKPALLLVALAGLMAVAASAAVASAPLEPRDGVVYSGVSTPGVGRELDSFLSASGQPSVAIYNRFTAHELSSFDWVLDEFEQRPVVGMISWWLSTPSYSPGTAGGTSASVARGDIDAHILARASEARAYAKPLFIRLNWEMNAYFWPWGAYDRAGKARPGNSHAEYRSMWRRTVILFRGGTRGEINARLAAEGMPGLTTSAPSVAPTPNVAWVWNANYASNPARDDAFAYWPGHEYVDWTGVDWYAWESQTHGAQSALPNAIYDRHSGPSSAARKPFMVGEWSGRDADRPAWTADMLDWMQARPMVKAALYFNYDPSSGYLPLEQTTQTRSLYRQAMQGARWIRDFRQVEVGGGLVPPPPPPAAPPAPGPAAPPPTAPPAAPPPTAPPAAPPPIVPPIVPPTVAPAVPPPTIPSAARPRTAPPTVPLSARRQPSAASSPRVARPAPPRPSRPRPKGDRAGPSIVVSPVARGRGAKGTRLHLMIRDRSGVSRVRIVLNGRGLPGVTPASTRRAILRSAVRSCTRKLGRATTPRPRASLREPLRSCTRRLVRAAPASKPVRRLRTPVLAPGRHTIRVVAYDSSGAKTVLTRRITVGGPRR